MLPARILLVDDQAEVRDGIGALLRLSFDVIGTACTGAGMIAAASALRPDVIVTDIAMPGIDGIEATRRVRHDHPECKVVFLSSSSDPEIVRDALSTGASGYVLKLSAGRELASAVTAALHGRRFVSPALLGAPPASR